jgi:formate hydrogenlyase transcriptional activator
MNMLEQAPWPGNVRELENMIERSVILSTGSILKVPTLDIEKEKGSASSLSPDICEQTSKGNTSLEAVEREHILKVLENTKGRISGPFGAAAILGMKPTTLTSKLHRLKISIRDAKTK